MSSAYCAQMVAAYTAAREQLQALSSPISSCTDSLPVAMGYTDKMIINGVTIDKGKLKQVSISLDKLKDAFETVIGECDAKIAEWQAAYEEALKAEEAARLAAAALTSGAIAGAVATINTSLVNNSQLHLR